MKDSIKEIASNRGGAAAKKSSGKKEINLLEIIGNAFFVLSWLWIVMLMTYFTVILFLR